MTNSVHTHTFEATALHTTKSSKPIKTATSLQKRAPQTSTFKKSYRMTLIHHHLKKNKPIQAASQAKHSQLHKRKTNSTSENWFVILDVNSTKTRSKIDSGSQVNMIQKKDYQLLRNKHGLKTTCSWLTV